MERKEMERKEPTFSNTPPEPVDENPARPQRPSQGSGAGQSAKAQPRSEQRAANSRPAAPSKPVTSSGGGSGLAVLALLIALVGVGGSGYLGWQLYQSQGQLADAGQRILDLEQRLDLTSDQSSETVNEIRDKLQWADSEIRKLWGVSHDTNRRAIAANRENIERLTRDMTAVKKDASDAKTQAAALQKQVADSKAAVDKALGELNTKLGGVDNQRALLQSMSERLGRAESQLQSIGNINSKVQSHEEAIAAIDTYRRTVNRDLLQIKQQLGIPTN